MDDLEWLERWYEAQCRGDWAQDRGLSIESLDNPGWLVKVDLRGTSLEAHMSDSLLRRSGEPPRMDNGNIGGPDWLECVIREGKLRDILHCFREWACAKLEQIT